MSQHPTCPLCERFLCPPTARAHPECTGVICQECAERVFTLCPFCRFPDPLFQPLDLQSHPVGLELLAVHRRCSAYPSCQHERAGACEIVRHEAECAHLTAVCPVEGCGMRVAREDMEAHVQECACRPRWCVLCGGRQHAQDCRCPWGALDRARDERNVEVASLIIKRVVFHLFGLPPWSQEMSCMVALPSDALGRHDCARGCRRLWRIVRGWAQLGHKTWGSVSMILRVLEGKASKRYQQALLMFLRLHVEEDLDQRVPVAGKSNLLPLFVSELPWHPAIAACMCQAHFLWNEDRREAFRVVAGAFRRLFREDRAFAEQMHCLVPAAMLASEGFLERHRAIALCVGLERLPEDHAEESPFDACWCLSAGIQLASRLGAHDRAGRMAALQLQRVMPLLKMYLRGRKMSPDHDSWYCKAFLACVHAAIALARPEAPAGIIRAPRSLRLLVISFMPDRFCDSPERLRSLVSAFMRVPCHAHAVERLLRALDRSLPEYHELADDLLRMTRSAGDAGKMLAQTVLRSAGPPAEARDTFKHVHRTSDLSMARNSDCAAALDCMEDAFKRECVAERLPAAFYRGTYLMGFVIIMAQRLRSLSGGQQVLMDTASQVCQMFVNRDVPLWHHQGGPGLRSCVFDCMLFTVQHGCSLLRDHLQHGSSDLPCAMARAKSRMIWEKVMVVLDAQSTATKKCLLDFHKLAHKALNGTMEGWVRVSVLFIVAALSAHVLIPTRAVPQLERRRGGRGGAPRQETQE